MGSSPTRPTQRPRRFPQIHDGCTIARRMPHRLLPLLVLAGTLLSCTLPGANSPTPFAFPTPDLTLTAAFAPSPTPLIPTRTLPPANTPTPTATQVIPGATAGATGTSSPATLDTRPNGSPVEAALLETPPTIDGDLADWADPGRELANVVFGASNWTGAGDASARFHIGWTEQGLYLGLQVTDDKRVQVSSGRNIFKGDIVELQLDSDLSGDFFSNSLTSDDYQIGLSPGNYGSLGSEAWRWYPIGLAGSLSGVSLRAVTTTEGYNLEAMIPWTVFGVTPDVGDRFGFALSISDNDLSGAPVQQSMVSTISTRTLTNPTTWGTLILK